MLTEQPNPNAADLDTLSTLQIVQRINEADRTVADAVSAALPQIAQAIDAIAPRLRDGGRLFYVGAGTSGRLGMLDAVECVPTFGTAPEQVQAVIAGGEAALTQAVEGAEDDRERGGLDLRERGLNSGDAVVGIAASGRTPYVLGAMDYAQSVGVVTVGIACNSPAPLLDAANIAIPLLVGAEVLTGSTRLKAGTAQKMTLNMISTGVMVQLGKVYGNLMVDVRVTNAKLADRARRIVQQVTGVDAATAADLLDRADQHAKTAIVMHIRTVDQATAQHILTAHGGSLRAVLASS